MAASSSSAQDLSTQPNLPLLLQQQQQQQQHQQPSPSSRRLPPPCWTHDETLALIDSYREKWYSLRRGNLRATHWQEVAESVGRQCPLVLPSKTSVQCRHKIEKLRKRYRTEKQRALTVSAPNRNRFSSSWVFFKKMDSMEKGPSSSPNSDSSDNEDDEEDDDNDNDEHVNPNTRSMHGLMANGINTGRSSRGGFRLRIPGKGASSVPPISGFGSKSYGRVDENPNPGFDYSGFLNGCSSSKSGLGSVGGGGSGRVGGKREVDPVAEMVLSIKMLGDGFVKMEQMKIEMAREMEKMRMEIELKRTEMILESQQRIVDAFARGLSEKKKKMKRMPSPDC